MPETAPRNLPAAPVAKPRPIEYARPAEPPEPPPTLASALDEISSHTAFRLAFQISMGVAAGSAVISLLGFLIILLIWLVWLAVHKVL